MADKYVPLPPKELVFLLCFYDGTPITLQIEKKKYADATKHIKEGAKKLIDTMLKSGYSKEQVADDIQADMEDMLKKILAVGSVVSDENLEKAWGADWKKKEIVWALNIACLLRLKRIKNDNNYGWSLYDHNSAHHSMEGGDLACVFGNGIPLEKMMKKANALLKTMKQ